MQQTQKAFPTYSQAESKPEGVEISYVFLTAEESEKVPETHRKRFTDDGQTTVHDGLNETNYVTPSKSCKVSLSKNSFVEFSAGVAALSDYYGIASDVLSSAHKFSRKQKKPEPPTISVHKDTKGYDQIIKLVEAKSRSKELANGRGDFDGVPSFFQNRAKEFATKNKLDITIFKGDELVEKGFRLMHAVGRASKNAPTFINMKYQGNPDSDQWVAFVGKGVCFDAGGLNIKPTSGIKDMYLDKHGACSVFSAFETLVQEKAKINVTVSMGFVENFVASNSYRPSDIIKSRKGLMVEIGNTDAEGRLVLADCMHWTQQNYKTKILIELSTLTGAIIIALGHRYAGVFSNDDGLVDELRKAGKQVHQQVWHMPLEDYHRDLIKHKFADITNSAGKPEASSSQAGAFLQNFVEKGVKWVHMDIAGAAMVNAEGNGYGARILVQYARNSIA